jgi:hypothetical protein
MGTWSVREMLAHLAGWDATDRRAVGEVQRGELTGGTLRVQTGAG